MDNAVKLVFKFLVLADNHLSGREKMGSDESYDPADLWPHHMKRIGKQAAKVLLARIVRACRQAWQRAVEFAHDFQPDLIVLAGDATGGHCERGLAHPAARAVATDMVNDLTPIAPIYMSGGNHESGYGKAKGDLGGFQLSSLESQREIFGPLWWTYDLGKLKVVGISSEICADRPETEVLRAEQTAFLGQLIETDLWNRPWVLVVHNIAGIKWLSTILEMQRYSTAVLNCQAVIIGDLHSPGKFRLVRNALYAWERIMELDLHRPRSFAKLLSRTVLCPSTAPLWWRGFGALAVTWDDAAEKLTIKEMELLPKADYEPVPTANFWTCLLWCIR